MVDYQSNSRKGKEEPPKREQLEKVVITGEVVKKPKSIGYKFRNIFLGGDLRETSKYVVAEVIFPGLRDMLFDTGRQTLQRLIYGESRMRRRSEPEPRSTVSYYSYSQSHPALRDPRDTRPNLPDQPRHRSTIRDIDNIILTDRKEAEAVVERLMDMVEHYDNASVADLYDLLGWSSSPIDNKWGWNNLNRLDIRQVSTGYLIELPPIEAI